jgi:hypothetical protein
MGLFGTLCHVGVGDLRNGREEEYASQAEHKNSNGKIHPLYIPDRGSRVFSILEESIRTEDRTHDGSDGSERLGQVDAEFGILRRSTHYERSVS